MRGGPALWGEDQRALGPSLEYGLTCTHANANIEPYLLNCVGQILDALVEEANERLVWLLFASLFDRMCAGVAAHLVE